MTREELFDRYVKDALDEAATAELEKLLTEDAEFAVQFAQDLLATGLFVQIGNELRRIEGEADDPELVPGASPPASPPRGGLLPSPSPPPPPPPPPSPSLRVAKSPHLGLPAGLLGERHQQPVLRSSTQRAPTVAIAVAVLLLAGIGVALILGLNRPAPKPPANAGVVAVVDATEGAVMLTHEIGQEEATAGRKLFEGDMINVQRGAARIAFVAEKTYLHIRAESEIRLEDQAAGKRIRLSFGEVTAEAAPQPVGRPMVISTSHGSARLGGAKATIRAFPKQTLVEVSQGAVQVSQGAVAVERRPDEGEIELRAGSWAMLGEGAPLTAWEFVAGVNLNGEAVEIDGQNWLSYRVAQSQGLVAEAIGNAPEARKSIQQPIGYLPGLGVREVLMTSVAAKAARLSIKWPQPNGRYQVFVWMMEDEGNQIRSLRLNVEEKMVAEGLGKDQLVGQWNRFGPYPATVEDGSLDLLMSADRKLENRDPHLAGLAVYRMAGTGPAAPAAPGAPGPSLDEIPPAEIPADPGTPPAMQPTVP